VFSIVVLEKAYLFRSQSNVGSKMISWNMSTLKNINITSVLFLGLLAFILFQFTCFKLSLIYFAKLSFFF